MILITLTLIVWMTTALRQISLVTDQGQSLLRPARQQVCFGGGDVRIHHLVGFSESGQFSASFLEQDQPCCYVARPALRPSHFFAYQGH